MWIGRAWETFVGVLNEPHISKKRLLGSLKWKEGKNVDGINDKKKNVCFFIYTQYLLTLWLKDLPAVVDVKLAHSLLHIYLKSPIWRSEVVLLFFLNFFICCHSTTCMCTSLIMKTLTWLTFLQGQFDILCIGSDIDAALPLLGMLLPQTGMH